MQKLSFESIMRITIIFTALCGVSIITFTVIKIMDEISAANQIYTVTQNDATYIGSIIRADDYVKVTDKDDTMTILDAAHGPINIRRSDLGNHPID